MTIQTAIINVNGSKTATVAWDQIEIQVENETTAEVFPTEESTLYTGSVTVHFYI